MIEQPRIENEHQEVSPEKGWVSFLIRIRQEVVKKAHDLIKARPEEEAIVLAEVDMLDGILKEISETGIEGRRQFIESSWQDKKIPQDIYAKLMGRMEVEVELGGLVEEAGLGKEVTQEKINEPEASKAVAEVVEEVVQKNSFWSKFREKISGKIKAPEIWNKIKEKKIFGQTVPAFLTGLGTGAAVRYTTRFGLGFLTGGTGYVLGTLSGGVSGGVLEGTKAYKKEKGRERDVLSDEELAKKIGELRGKKIKEKLESYLDAAKIKESQIWSEEKNRLRKELEEKLKSKEAWKAFWGGAWKGAAIGAFGGFVGSYLSDLAGQYFASEKVVKAASLAKEAGEETLKRELEDAAADAYNKSLEKSLASGLTALKEKSFEVSAEKGEGATHVARKLIHDYLAQNYSLGNEVRLGKGELVYAEDALRRMFEEGTVHFGDTFSATGEDIAQIVEKARGLGKEVVKNLEEQFASKINPETWERMTTYHTLENSANDFTGGILQQANDGAAEAANKAVQETIQIAVEVKAIPAEIIKAKDDWFKTNWFKWGFIGAGAIGATALGYKFGRKYGEKSEPVKLSKRINLISKFGGPEEGTSEKEMGELPGVLAPELPEVGPPKETKTRTFKEVIEFEDITTDKIQQKFGIHILIRSSMSLSEDQAYEGSKKLREILLADKTLVEKLHGVSIRIDDKDAEPEKIKSRAAGSYIRITADYSKSPEEMRRHLEDAAEKAEKL